MQRWSHCAQVPRTGWPMLGAARAPSHVRTDHKEKLPPVARHIKDVPAPVGPGAALTRGAPVTANVRACGVREHGADPKAVIWPRRGQLQAREPYCDPLSQRSCPCCRHMRPQKQRYKSATEFPGTPHRARLQAVPQYSVAVPRNRSLYRPPFVQNGPKQCPASGHQGNGPPPVSCRISRNSGNSSVPASAAMLRLMAGP